MNFFLILNLNCSSRLDFWSSHDTSTSFELLLLESVGQPIFEILKIKCSLLCFFKNERLYRRWIDIDLNFKKYFDQPWKKLKFGANVHLALKWLTMSISVQLSANEHSVFLIAPISIQIQFIFYSEFESLRPILRENVSGNAEIIFTLG